MRLLLTVLACFVLSAQQALGDFDPKVLNHAVDTKTSMLDDMQSIFNNMQHLGNMTLEKYNKPEESKPNDFEEDLEKYMSSCQANKIQPVFNPEEQNPVEQNPEVQNPVARNPAKPQLLDLPRRFYKTGVHMSKNFTKSELFAQFVKGGLRFSLTIAAFLASLLSKVPQCVENVICTMSAKSIATATKEFVNSREFEDVGGLTAQAIGMLVDLIPDRI